VRGLVYHDQDGDLILLIFHEHPSLHAEYGPISDCDNLYANLPPSTAEICDVEKNEAIGMVWLKSLCSITLAKNNINCPAYEAIEAALKSDPRELYVAISS